MFPDFSSLSTYLGDMFKHGTDANKSAFGTVVDGQKTMGYMSPVLGGLGTIADLWSGMQQMDLAKQQLAFQKDAFAKNWNAQRTTTNAALADRQNARLGANPTGYESLSSYMQKNGI